MTTRTNNRTFSAHKNSTRVWMHCLLIATACLTSISLFAQTPTARTGTLTAPVAMERTGKNSIQWGYITYPTGTKVRILGEETQTLIIETDSAKGYAEKNQVQETGKPITPAPVPTESAHITHAKRLLFISFATITKTNADIVKALQEKGVEVTFFGSSNTPSRAFKTHKISDKSPANIETIPNDMSGEFKNATPPHPTIDYAQIKDFDAIYYCGSNCFDVYNLPTKEISESKTLIIANDRSRTIAQATILPEEQKKGTPAKTQIKDIIPYTKDQLISKEYILHSYPHRIFFDVAPFYVSLLKVEHYTFFVLAMTRPGLRPPPY